MFDETNQANPEESHPDVIQAETKPPDGETKEPNAETPAPSNFRAAGPLNPSLNEDKFDSRGEPKEGGLVGPRGANLPPEHLSEPQKRESAAAEQKRLQQGMASTDFVDSRGENQGEFKVEPQGNDKHGARIPDKVTDELVDAPPAMVGPRGKDAPPESFHHAGRLKTAASKVGHELEKAGEAIVEGAVSNLGAFKE